MRLSSVVSVGIFLAACGDDGGSNVDAATDDAAMIDAPDIDAAPLMLLLTSTAYTDGGVIPSAQACVGRLGMNQSPPLAWSNVPAGTMSFAIVFTDLNNGLVHSAIYDIPGTLTSVPGMVDKVYAPIAVPGAHHPPAYTNVRGYEGPCPNDPHMYQHKIYALATATVPNTMMSTTRAQLVTELEAANLGTGTLTATFTP
ncbi:MAG: YbhB/YbcL family Raf kinase inhibitor-like protein [Kofleriaceae bacterium]